MGQRQVQAEVESTAEVRGWKEREGKGVKIIGKEVKEENWNGKESETEHIKKEERRGDKTEIQ